MKTREELVKAVKAVEDAMVAWHAADDMRLGLREKGGAYE